MQKNKQSCVLCSSLMEEYFFASSGKDDSLEVFVGDVTSYTLRNLLPGTTYDVKVFAQYDGGMSGALAGQGTTRKCFWKLQHGYLWL